MRVERAEAMGMCFGVRDALTILDGIAEPGEVTIHGELVHNESVLDGLRRRGFGMSAESDRDATRPPTPVMLITAHGISQQERSRLEAAGTRLVDTTCPLVERAHRAARMLNADGRHLVIIGQPGHVEVRGIVEDLASYDVVPNPESVRTYPHDRIGVICQTTVAPRRTDAVRAAILARNPHADIRFADTTCQPTRDRQQAMERLADRVDAVVVVGGSKSNNTRELVALCRERGRPAWHVRGPEDLDSSWFRDVEVVGLTAGTSTPDATIDAVHRALLSIAAANGAVA